MRSLKRAETADLGVHHPTDDQHYGSHDAVPDPEPPLALGHLPARVAVGVALELHEAAVGARDRSIAWHRIGQVGTGDQLRCRPSHGLRRYAASGNKF